MGIKRRVEIRRAIKSVLDGRKIEALDLIALFPNPEIHEVAVEMWREQGIMTDSINYRQMWLDQKAWLERIRDSGQRTEESNV